MEKKVLRRRVMSFILALMLIIPMLPIGVVAESMTARNKFKESLKKVMVLDLDQYTDESLGDLESLISTALDYSEDKEKTDEELLNLIDRIEEIYSNLEERQEGEEKFYNRSHKKTLEEINSNENLEFNLKFINWYWLSDIEITEDLVNRFEEENQCNYSKLIEVKKDLEVINLKLEEELNEKEEPFIGLSHKKVLSEINNNENLKFNLEFIVWYWNGDLEIREDIINTFKAKNRSNYNKIIDVYKDLKDIDKELESEKDFIGLSHKKVLSEINTNENLKFNLEFIAWYWVMDLEIDDYIVDLFEYNNPKNFTSLIGVKKYLNELEVFQAGDKTELKEIIEEIENLDLEVYTEDTSNPLRESLVEAKIILSDERAGQAIVDSMVREILAKKSDLVEKPVEVDLKRGELEEWLDGKIDEISSIYIKSEVNGDWVMAELGKLDIKNSQASIDKQIERIFDEEGNYKGENANELLKIILALRASGVDPEDVYGINLVEELIINKETRGFYYDSCGLWAINSDDYEVVEKYQDRVDGMVERLLTAMEPGYVTSGFSKFDDTGFALLALAPYYKGTASGKYNASQEVKEVVNKSLRYIAEHQLEDGDFENGGSWGSPNSNTLSMILMGISAIDPELIWDMDYVKDSNTLLSVLKEKYDIKDGFKWKATDGKSNPMATEQGLRSLINYRSMLDGSGTVFDYRGKEKLAIEKEIEENPFKVLENKDGELVIVGYETTDVPVNLVIPATINGKPVRHIGNEVFSYSDYVSPPSKTKNPIESVVLPEGLLTIGTRAFSNANLEELIIPSTVVEIKDRAFFGNKNLSKIEFMEDSGLKSIGAYAFSASYSQKNYIKEVELPEGLEKIGERAFDGQKISEIKLPESLKDLGSAAFGNNMIEEVVIPVGVEELGLTEPNRSGKRKDGVGAFWKNTDKDGNLTYTRVKDLSDKANSFNVLGIVNPTEVTVRYVDETGKEVKESIKAVGIELNKGFGKGEFKPGTEKLLTDYVLGVDNYKFFNSKKEMEKLSGNYFSQGKEYLFKAPAISGYESPEDKALVLDSEAMELTFEYKKIEGNFDREELDRLVKEVESLNEADYTKESLDALKAALKLSEKNQVEIDQKVQSIKDAVDNLKSDADKKNLEREIRKSENLAKELEVMKELGQREFREALEDAKLVFEAEEALQKEVDEATKGLLAARGKLSRKPITVKIRIETNDRTIFEESEITFDHEAVEPLFEKAGYDKLERSTYYRPIEAILLAVDSVGIDVSNTDEFDGGLNGSFITKIGSLEMNSINASMDGWMYWVNNHYANLGVNAFEINDQDKIDLFFKEDYMETKYAYFTETKKEVKVGEEFELELKFNHFDKVDGIEGAKILIDDLESDFITDENGRVIISFDKPGSYHISAEKKNEDGLRIITRPYAKIEVKAAEKPELDRTELEKLLSRAEVVKSRKFNEEKLEALNLKLRLEETSQEEIDKKVKELENHLKELEKVLKLVVDITEKVEEINRIDLEQYTDESSKELRSRLDKLNKKIEDDSIVNENGQALMRIPRMLDYLVSKLVEKPELNRTELEKLLEEAKKYTREEYGGNVHNLEIFLELPETSQEEIDKKIEKVKEGINYIERYKIFLEESKEEIKKYSEIDLNSYTEESSKEFKKSLTFLKDLLDTGEAIKMPFQMFRGRMAYLKDLSTELVEKPELNRTELEKLLEEAKKYTREEYGGNIHNLEIFLELPETSQEEIDKKIEAIKLEIKGLKEFKDYVETTVVEILNDYETLNLGLYTEESTSEFKEILEQILEEVGDDKSNLIKFPAELLREKIDILEKLLTNFVRKELISAEANKIDGAIELSLTNLSDEELDLEIFIGQYDKDDNSMLDLQSRKINLKKLESRVEEIEVKTLENTITRIFIWDLKGNPYTEAILVENIEDMEEKTIFDYRDRIEKSIEKTASVALATNHSMDWVALGLGTSGNKNMIPGDYLDSVVKYLDENNGEFKGKPTEYERMAIGIISAGGNPRKIGKYDLIEKIYNSRDLDKQGINAMAFGLIALDLRDYEVPEDALWTRDKIIEWILKDECSNKGTDYNRPGGWAWGPMDKADVDMTAMVLTALAPYNNSNYPEVEAAMKRGFDWLRYAQKEDGHFGSWGSKTSESSAQVIMAAAANGLDPVKEFSKNGVNVVDAILSYEVETGGFAHMELNGKLNVNGMATEQALYALAQIKSFIDGKGSIYKFAPEVRYSIKGLENGEVLDESIKTIRVESDGSVIVLLNGKEVKGRLDYKLNLIEGINEIEIVIAKGSIDESTEKYRVFYEKKSIDLELGKKVLEGKTFIELKLENLEDIDLTLEVNIGQYDKDTNKMIDFSTRELFLEKGQTIVEEVEVETLENLITKIFIVDLEGNPYTDTIIIK